MTQQHEPAGGSGLVEALAAAARQVESSDDAGSEAEAVSLIVSAAVETVPGAEQAGVSLLRGDGSITSQAVSAESVRAVDQLQASYREGPCVTALWDQRTVLVEDMTSEAGRWPRFGPAAAAAGVGSMLSFQLYAAEQSLGALNLYANEPGRFTVDSQTLGGLFAMHAATALGQAQHVNQLHEALASRDVIGQAKGMLMERFGLDAEQAFGMLVRSSQETNLKLVAVARWLTSTSPTDAPQD